MGHLSHLKHEYRALAQRLQAGTTALVEPSTEEGWRGFPEILEILYTPEDAALAARLPTVPTSLRAIAARLSMPEAELAPRLTDMAEQALADEQLRSRFVRFALRRVQDPAG